jgi:hypothetical protein
MFRKIVYTFILVFVTFYSFAQDRHFTSPLPLVFIDTNGRQIPDDPKIPAKMGIVWKPSGEMNSTRDPFNHYDGFITIEIRGSSSQMFPKKSYGFETCDEAGQDIDFPLLGLPEEEDWIFYGPYSDKSLIRNALTFSLSQPLGRYSSRVRFTELFLNNKYQGIYLLMEKIKRDKVRVDIAKLNPDETSGEDLTGGYIVKIDKTTGSGGEGWHSKYQNSNVNPTFYQYEVPADDEIVPEQKAYIQNYISAFEDAVYNQKIEGPGNYREYIDIPSFADYILVSELTKNVDAYRLSTFLHKNKNGRLIAGPIWDFNLAFGNANYHNAWLAHGFQIQAKMESDHWGNPFWWEELWVDTVFVNFLKCRWNRLRETHWSNVRIFEVADSLVNELGGAAGRNFERWPVLGQYVWPNYYVASSHQDEMIWMKKWIENRLWWLDANLPGNCGGVLPPVVEGFKVSVYPNPVHSELFLNVSSDAGLSILFQLFNVNGTMIKEQRLSIAEGEQILNLRLDELPKGLYFYVLVKGYEPFQQGKLVKF